jgi:hypothetical protein
MATYKRMPEITMQDVDGVMLRTAYWEKPAKSQELPLVFFNGIGANVRCARRRPQPGDAVALPPLDGRPLGAQAGRPPGLRRG